jgi:hypothetical protein
MTDKAFEIRNCCCLIIRPWTPEEISDAWGLTREGIRRSQEKAFRKLQRKVRIMGKDRNPQPSLTERSYFKGILGI